MNENPQLIEIAKAAAKINDQLGISFDEACENLLKGIRKHDEYMQALFDVVFGEEPNATISTQD